METSFRKYASSLSRLRRVVAAASVFNVLGLVVCSFAIAQGGIPITEDTTVSFGLLIGILVIVLGQVPVAWYVAARATAALPRIEAYLNFVTKLDNSEAHAEIKTALKELAAKLDSLTLQSYGNRTHVTHSESEGGGN
jgi:hypothetical protein